MKISWGTKIAILYLSFVTLIIVMVFMCMHQSIDLVSEDYYEKELGFQKRIDGMNNAKELSVSVEHLVSGNDLILQYPSNLKQDQLLGEILFFCPSNASKDFRTSVKPDNQGRQLIDLKNLSKGMYRMQIDFSVEGKQFFVEQVIVIP